MAAQPSISVRDLTVRYGSENVVDSVTFDVAAGDTVMIIGPNGSGKTTLLRAMLGLIPRKNGSVEIAGHPMHFGCRDVGYVPQRFGFDQSFPITVTEFLRLAVWYEKNKNKIEHAITHSLQVVGMSPNANQQIAQLSGGQLQRVLIARAILHQPKVLVLDEPASGIDISGELNFYQLITRLKEELNMTILMVSHDIDTVFKYANQVLCLNKKMLCYGKPASVLNDEMFRALYSNEAVLYQHGH